MNSLLEPVAKSRFSNADRRQLLLAECVLRDCPDFLTAGMINALRQAGVDLPAGVRAKFQDNPTAEAVRFPMKGP